MKFKFKKPGQGFTIVELLIVIVVIGLLAALVIVQFSNVQARARDSERKSDIRAIQSKVAEFYALNGAYPTALDSAGLELPAEACKGPGAAPTVDCSTTPSYTYKAFLQATTLPTNETDAVAATADGTDKYILYTTGMETGGENFYSVSSN